VNGNLAEVQGEDFAVIVPLQVGQNILTAIATTVDGFQVQTSITINTTVQQEIIRFTATPASGILNPVTNVLNVTFEAEAYLPNPVSSYSWDFNGDGVAEVTGMDPTVIAQYQYPGIYFPRVTVTDNQGNVYTETTLVNVLSREEMDALLRSKWEGMKGALANQDITNALNYFGEETKQHYSELFTALQPYLPQVVQEMQDIQLIVVRGKSAKYRMTRNELYGGQMVTIDYSVYFVADKNGLWKIDWF
jgi:hypothetical protein